MEPYIADDIKRRKKRDGESLEKLLPTPGVKAAIICSPEGLPIASALPQGVDEARIAAITSTLLSLSEKANDEMKMGKFDQLCIKCSAGHLLILQAGPNAALALSLSATQDVYHRFILSDLRRIYERIQNSLGWEEPITSEKPSLTDEETEKLYLESERVKKLILKEEAKAKKAGSDYTFKIIVLGDADIPKSPFTKRYCYNLFDPSEDLTIGVDFHVKSIELHGKRIKLKIWDFGADEQFQFLLPTYLREVKAAILLYDITNPSTFEHIPDWVHRVRKEAGDIPIILVGAKVHLEDLRAVSKEEGILAAKKYNLSDFIEVSSKTGQNVRKAFELIITVAMSLEKSST